MQTEIANVLTDIRHRTISPILVSPKQLRQIREHIPPDQQLPVSSKDVIQLYRIMHAEGTTTTHHVVFKITLPLVSTAQQEVFGIIPIPVWKEGNWHEFKLKTEIITVNDQRDQFMGLTKDKFEQCLQLPNDEHICFNHQATFSVDNRSVCKGIPSTIHIDGTGLLSLETGCTARNSKISVSTFSTQLSETKSTYVRFGNITRRIRCPTTASGQTEGWENEVSAVQHYQIAAYVALAVSIILIIAVGLRQRRSNWKPRRRTSKPQTTSEQPTLEPTPRSLAFDISDG
ncbi:hypothetical protein KR054_000165 [Drosophila jambulina]|nr:hypothetical protein KR054_000165 [Drosophila jambulina]